MSVNEADEPVGNDVARKGFPTTRWSLILHAGQGHEREAQDALARLCGDYWRPLQDFARRKGCSPEDAQDLTQGFIAWVLETGAFARADRDRGRFRTYLLAAFSNFIHSQHRKDTALKRGGAQAPLPLNVEVAEFGDDSAGRDWETPERVFERSWALAVLERALAQLQEEYVAAGREQLFQAIQPQLTGGVGRPGYAAMAAALRMSESAVTVAVHRMRNRYGALLRAEIAETVATPEDVEDELRHLIAVVSGGSARGSARESGG